MSRLVLALSAMLLAGCVSPEEQAAQRRAQWEQARAFAAAQDDTTCRSYGLPFGTEAYANCRLALEAQRRNAAAQNDAIARGVVLQHLLAR